MPSKLLLRRFSFSGALRDRQEEHRQRKPQHDRNEPSELGAVRTVFDIQEPFQHVHRRDGHDRCEQPFARPVGQAGRRCTSIGAWKFS
jgi:hypothetical protein